MTILHASSRKSRVLALSVGQTLAKLIGLATMVVMARVLLKEDLAAYQQTLLAYVTLAPLLSLGVGQGMYYFLPAEKTRVRGRIMDGVTVLGIMGLLFAAFLALGGNTLLAERFSNPQVANMLLWLIPYSIVTLPASTAESVLVARDKVMLASVFGLLRQLLIGMATVVPLIIWHTAQAPLIGNVVGSILMGIAALALMLRSAPRDSAMPTVGGIQELLRLTLPLALAGMTATISLQLDKIIVSVMCTPDQFAVYALGAMEIPLIGIVTGAITAVMLADMRKSVAAGDRPEALRLFRRTAEKSAYVILPAMIFLMITADSFIQLLYTREYADSAIPFRWYLTLLPIRTVVFGSLIIALGRSRFILFRSVVGLLLNALLSVLLVWRFGPWGAVVATVATIYLWSVPANLYVLSSEMQRRWSEVLPIGEFGKIGLAMLPLALVSYGLSRTIEDPVLEFVTVAAVFAAYLAWFWNNRIYSFAKLRKKLSLAH